MDDIIIKPNPNHSGEIRIIFRAISYPSGTGKEAVTGNKEFNLSIKAIADEPYLEINEDEDKLKINPTGWLDIGQLVKTIYSPDEDGSEEIFILISCINTNGEKIPFPADSKLNSLTAEKEDDTWIISEDEVSNLKLYLGIIDESVSLNIGIQSKEGESTKDGNNFTIKVPSNRILKAPILEITSDLVGNEDEYMPLMQSRGGIIKGQLRDQVPGQSLLLKISGIDKGIELVRRQINENDKIEYSSPLNKTIEDNDISSELMLEYSQWNDIYIKGPDNEYGEYSFDVQAISKLGNKQKETQIQNVQIDIKPVNDQPTIIDASDLKAINEGEIGEWNLRDRFFDVDNLSTQIDIEVKVIKNNGNKVNLPTWLHLNDSGILSGIPENEDVGNLELEITATDQEGLQIKMITHLRVGNINDPPLVHRNYKGLDDWIETQDGERVIYSRDILLREESLLIYIIEFLLQEK